MIKDKRQGFRRVTSHGSIAREAAATREIHVFRTLLRRTPTQKTLHSRVLSTSRVSSFYQLRTLHALGSGFQLSSNCRRSENTTQVPTIPMKPHALKKQSGRKHELCFPAVQNVKLGKRAEIMRSTVGASASAIR
ncbi:hypothetical protein L596_011221 [Steinernema carpocapsae]|uniref:Uncharacterized protein n=1 Tax=Steinernema carpocapsae TaxID=34508 RepID=A0A4U5NU08_STECR|nr:hypothetical protein L596_011221 [Steinernema carpocapsae]